MGEGALERAQKPVRERPELGSHPQRQKAAAVTKFAQKRAPPWENGCISMVPRISEIP